MLNDVTTANGRKLGGQLFVVEGQFIEEEGYEPPQGSFKETRTASATERQEEEGASGGRRASLAVQRSRWKLSEDPDDPKDGLWIWGLFKEPLYPFLLLQMDTQEVTLPSSDEGDADRIPPLTLYARVDHVRDRDAGTVELRGADVNVRVAERIQLPGASVDVFEEEAVGQISFQPL